MWNIGRLLLLENWIDSRFHPLKVPARTETGTFLRQEMNTHHNDQIATDMRFRSRWSLHQNCFPLDRATTHIRKALCAIRMLSEVGWIIRGVFLNLSLSEFKCTPINHKKLRGHRLSKRFD